MQKLEERTLLAMWKSYKTFKQSGEVRLHTVSLYREFHFAEERILTVNEYKRGQAETIFKTTKWTLEFSNKRHYLKILQPKWTFEIITVNHTVLVLLDHLSWDKTFFAKGDCWQNYLQSNVEMAM